MGSNNSSTTTMLLLLACCLSSSAASGAGAYFLGYVPGNDKYYIRIFQLEKMFQILEDIKNDLVYEGTAPNKYTGKISGTDFCDEVKDFYENLIEKRDDEIEKVSDNDFKKLVKNYMDDNEIEGYTYDQAIDIIDFLYASCGTDDARVFKKTDAFTTKLTKLFKATPDDYANFAPSAQHEADRKIFCNDDGDVKGFKSLRKEITDVTAVSSLGQLWDESTGTLGLSGFSLSDLTSSVDYCSKDFTPVTPPTCGEIVDKDVCDGDDNACTWTPADGTTLGACGDTLVAPVAAPVADAAAPVASDACTNFASSDLCTTPCEWDDVTGCATPQ